MGKHYKDPKTSSLRDMSNDWDFRGVIMHPSSNHLFYLSLHSCQQGLLLDRMPVRMGNLKAPTSLSRHLWAAWRNIHLKETKQPPQTQSWRCEVQMKLLENLNIMIVVTKIITVISIIAVLLKYAESVQKVLIGKLKYFHQNLYWKSQIQFAALCTFCLRTH